MLNIYIYKNVKFQQNYANVIKFANDSELLTYLSTFQEGTIANINKYFSNEKYIDLSELFEGCNYMVIHDTRSNKPYKYFFIIDTYFVSGNTIRYELQLDVWNTYANDMSIYNSRLISGHYDVLISQPNSAGVKRSLRLNLTGDNVLKRSDTIKVINTWANLQDATMFIIIKSSSGNQIIFSHIISDFQLQCAVTALQNNFYKTSPSGTNITYETQKVYIINDFDFNALISADNKLKVYVGNVSTTGMPEYYILTNTESDVVLSHYIIHEKYDFSDITTYEGRTDKLKKEYFAGTITTNQKVKVNSESNTNMVVEMYIYNTQQIVIYFNYGNIKLNITNDFEIPFTNDSYNLYMAQNQATIDTNNKANAVGFGTSLATSALSLALIPATAGASALIGAGMITSAINFEMQRQKTNAMITDAQKQIDRSDGLYSAGALTLYNGVGLFVVEYTNLKDVNEDLNLHGTTQLVYVNDYNAVNANLYNFYYVQFDEINVNGSFSYNIRQQFEEIFKNGVIIWTDKTKFLTNVNYKK